MTRVGLEVLRDDVDRWLPRQARVGLLVNPASADVGLAASPWIVAELLGDRLRALFSPQHGIVADVQDNMVESPHGRDAHLGIPVWSLYSETRQPTAAMLSEIDLLLVDLQDVGTRVYTFIWTLRLAMEACGAAGVPVVVLDRPNPLGGTVEGNRLRPEWRSFVGLEPIPMRHGLTLGELAAWFRGRGGVDCDLRVVPMEGWIRRTLWPATGRIWLMPSPNMPMFETALVYPGAVLFEGTTASEGRGTARPFELLGGPWVRAEALRDALDAAGLPGVAFRPLAFRPTFQKWQGQVCGGVQVHVTDPGAFRPYRTGLALLAAFWELYREQGFGWREPPYEYETERLPIDLLLGDRRLREAVEAGAHWREMASLWDGEEEAWAEEARPFHLYP